jgi:ribosome maturation factor RimP
MAERRDTVAGAVARVLARLDLELYDLELGPGGNPRTLRVLIDRPAGSGTGVDLDAITSATEAISRTLDTDPVLASSLPGPYTLEVSSPGVERRLRTPSHFRRVVGSTVSVKTRADGTALRRRGVVVAADDDGVELEIDGERARVEYEDIVAAQTVFEWGAPATSRGRAEEKARS